MRAHRTSAVLSFVVLMSVCSGCLWAPGLDRVRKEIQSQLPGASFKREFALSAGPMTLGLVRTVTRMVPDAHEAHRYLRDVSRVEVAIYEAAEVPVDIALKTPTRLETLVEKEGWEIAARIHENGDNVWLAYRVEDDAIKDLFVIALTEDELVLVKAHGNIDRLVAKAMSDYVVSGRQFPANDTLKKPFRDGVRTITL